MKSLDKKKTKKLDWEKELKLLAKQFPIFNADIKGLEQFIQSLLSQQRQEILEIIDKHLEDGNFENIDVLYELKKEINSLKDK